MNLTTVMGSAWSLRAETGIWKTAMYVLVVYVFMFVDLCAFVYVP